MIQLFYQNISTEIESKGSYDCIEIRFIPSYSAEIYSCALEIGAIFPPTTQ
jgi:hypothetical protein